jgi:hypothetical protein
VIEMSRIIEKNMMKCTYIYMQSGIFPVPIKDTESDKIFLSFSETEDVMKAIDKFNKAKENKEPLMIDVLEYDTNRRILNHVVIDYKKANTNE